MNTEDSKRIKRELLSGQLTWQDAMEIITSPLMKPWQEKEWKDKRKKVLKSYCEMCGSLEKLRIYQTFKPLSISDLFYKVRGSLQVEYDKGLIDWINNHPININLDSIASNTKLCPKCGSTAIRYKKGEAKYICMGKKEGVTCNNIFDTPMIGKHPLEISKLFYPELKKVKQEYQKYFDEVNNIGFRVVILSIDEHIKYLSFDNCKTYCNKCHYAAHKHLTICQKCKTNYHKVGYKTCFDCREVGGEDELS